MCIVREERMIHTICSLFSLPVVQVKDGRVRGE